MGEAEAVIISLLALTPPSLFSAEIVSHPAERVDHMAPEGAFGESGIVWYSGVGRYVETSRGREPFPSGFGGLIAPEGHFVVGRSVGLVGPNAIWNLRTGTLKRYENLGLVQTWYRASVDPDGVPVGYQHVGFGPPAYGGRKPISVPRHGGNRLPIPKKGDWNTTRVVTIRRARIIASGGRGVLVWTDPKKAPKVLPLPPDAVRAEAQAVSAKGHVAAMMTAADGTPSSWLWWGGKWTLLGGRNSDARNPFHPLAILDDGLVLGTYGPDDSAGSDLHAYRPEGGEGIPLYGPVIGLKRGMWLYRQSLDVADDGRTILCRVSDESDRRKFLYAILRRTVTR